MHPIGNRPPHNLDFSSSSATVVVAIEQRWAIRAAQAGDDDAFAWLVERYRHVALKAAFHIMRTEDAAADAVQDAWIKVHRAIHRFQEGNFRGWLVRIVNNTCYDHLRKEKRRPSISLDRLIENTGIQPQSAGPRRDPEAFLLRREQCDVLIKAIQGLAPTHRDVVVLIDVQGYDYKEAAALLSIPVGTVKSRLSRARASLRNVLVASDLL